ncbi:MAG: hypothetical protein UT66_C0003G0007 [candidate division CPR2 bacterium GW2011_GWC1_39_9]|uniref:ATP synthase subunit a n=1 Tax=candidate division CPR2 bacterium GW2011_GWC2_39_10 TaxID=1618345 RepID=A0A0G0Q0U5_UNCC2|nr:MAG: ATP synthase subunit a [candidate division CPR2 bacterium GW2011_GWC2_39_10]KKR36063.1 MAG: hypothetical protein UT66_C0003G0007 [candidate division CPR2 bacterium GW2011_GWC1_39_9]
MHISISAESIFHIGSIPFTNSMLAAWLVFGLLFLLSFLATRKMENIPKGLQNISEYIIEALFNLTEGITKDRKLTKKIFPLVATFFIFILFNNWMGLLPGFGSVGFHETNAEGHQVLVPLLRAGTADLNTTIAIAIVTVIAVQVMGIAAIGVKKYAGKFINFSSPVNFFVGIIETISEVSRIISYSFRLFGNVFAGEVLLAVMSTLVPYFIPLPFYIMEIFVGAVQALVFTMLSIVFMSMATVVHSESH